MSRRCSVCDFSPDMPSIYHEGLVTSDRPFVNRITKRIKGEDVCDHCYEEMRHLYQPKAAT
jgi:hypothetical protein